jgi:hypothetical protein
MGRQKKQKPWLFWLLRIAEFVFGCYMLFLPLVLYAVTGHVGSNHWPLWTLCGLYLLYLAISQTVQRLKSTQMGNTTGWVRRALADLGPNASDKDVEAYIRDKAPEVPQGQISLALCKIREKLSSFIQN